MWPFRYFVALCITRSTPSASGCWLIGLAKVLSITEMTPRARQAAATAAMSTQRSVGLIGDSNQTRRVFSDSSCLGRRERLDPLEPDQHAQPGEDSVSRCSVPP